MAAMFARGRANMAAILDHSTMVLVTADWAMSLVTSLLGLAQVEVKESSRRPLVVAMLPLLALVESTVMPQTH